MKFSANDYLHEEWGVQRGDIEPVSGGTRKRAVAEALVDRLPGTHLVHRWVSEWEVES
jgi:hypothetical protein